MIIGFIKTFPIFLAFYVILEQGNSKFLSNKAKLYYS